MSDQAPVYRRCKRCKNMLKFDPPDDEATDADQQAWGLLVSGRGETEHPPGECPHEIEAAAAAATGHHSYRLTLVVERDDEDEPLIKISSKPREGTAFADVSADVAADLNQTWLRILEQASIVDTPAR